MRFLLLATWLAIAGLTPAAAQLSFGFSSGGVTIGVNVPVYPRLVAVPGYPVYYAPDVGTNYFFYDGLYWVFQDGEWYESSWYNGPWELVPPDSVPLYVLRVPVRYYRHPPGFFRGWASNAPPRWDEHWGRDWTEHHRDWNQWDRKRVPARAPLPTYQRQYTGDRYPRNAEQAAQHDRSYRYQPRDSVVREHWQRPQASNPPAAREQRAAPQVREQQAPQARGERQAPQAREQRQAPQAREQRQAPQAREREAPRKPEASREKAREDGHGDNDNRRGSGPRDTGGG
jgi:hypothetical protein